MKCMTVWSAVGRGMRLTLLQMEANTEININLIHRRWYLLVSNT